MTAAEWLEATEPRPMPDHLKRQASIRKLRLFEVACCRRIWQFITNAQCRAVVEITDRSADAPVDVEAVLALNYDRLTDDCGGPDEQQRTAYMVAGHVGYRFVRGIHGFPPLTEARGLPYALGEWQDAVGTAEGAARVVALSRGTRPTRSTRAAGAKHSKFQANFAVESAVQCELLRDLFGNPFRPAPEIRPDWLCWNGGTVATLAESAYEHRTLPARLLDSGRLAPLADALEDGGCTDPELLGHLRGPGPHVRGCWALDLVLGKL
jgi:hypothetical protein